MEHKLISEIYREFLGYNGRQTIKFDVPAAGTKGHVTVPWTRLPYGVANLQRQGDDLTIVSIGIGVHRALQTAEKLSRQYSIGVIDLRTLSPLDKSLIIEQVAHTGRLLIVDEDYERFGLSGEIAAIVLESGMSYKFARVCTRTTIPYAHHLEKETIPNVRRICQAVHQLMES